jgi:hypothetical protein
MMMRFTREDATTFLIGLLAAAVVALGHALTELSPESLVDPRVWLINLAVGVAAATGRYLTTRLAEATSDMENERP